MTGTPTFGGRFLNPRPVGFCAQLVSIGPDPRWPATTRSIMPGLLDLQLFVYACDFLSHAKGRHV